MSQSLTTRDFHEIELTKKNKRKIFLRTPKNKECGYLLGGDLDYPSNIHEKTENFTFLLDEKR